MKLPARKKCVAIAKIPFYDWLNSFIIILLSLPERTQGHGAEGAIASSL